MCYQITEKYSACRCVYYIHAIDRCTQFDRAGHRVQKRTILVGYACSSHNSSYAGDENTVTVEDHVSDDDDTASIFSGISASSTNLTFPDDAKQEAADRLFHELLNEFSLRHLWPQIVRISRVRPVAVRVIVRYLYRLSRDLKTRASRWLDKDAARFVGASRLSVAERIVECHVNELRGVDDVEHFMKKQAPIDIPIQETDEKDDLDTDDKEIIYEHVQQFIFEGAPFESFVSSLKLFIARDPGRTSATTGHIRKSLNRLALWY